MTTHNLKTWKVFFHQTWIGKKTAEMRLNDRDYQPGDFLNQHEYAPEDGTYSGRVVRQKITHVVRGPVFGLAEGWAMLSTVILRREEGGR